MALTLRLTKGSPLTHTELDDNFSHLQGLINSLNTETGSLLYSGSFDESSSTLILYSDNQRYEVDLSTLVDVTDTGSFYISSSVNLNTITFTQGDGTTESVTVNTGSATGTNIYSTDGTLAGARSVAAGGNNLTFEFPDAYFTINSDPSQRVVIANLPTEDQPQVVGIDSSGTLKAMNTSSIAGTSTDISALNTFTGSIQIEVDNLTAATSSYLTATDTGSFYISSSVNLNTITFTQGDGTTESVTVDTGSGGGGDSNLVLDLVSNQTVGGVTSGDTFAAGESIESVLRDILITYIEPVLSNILIKLNGSTVSTAARDVGNSFTLNTGSFSAAVDNPDGNFPVSASFTASGADIGLQEIYISDSLSSTNNLGLGSILTINRATTAGTVTFRVNTESETTADTQTITTSVPFYWRNYLAASATDIGSNNDATNVVDFETVDSTLDTNISWTATCDSTNDDGTKYTYIIYPASYGDLSAVTQNGSLPVLTAFTKQTDRTVDNAYGSQNTFRIYKSNQPGAFDAGVELTIS